MCIESPKVSVVILANTEDEYLSSTIDNIQKQTFADFEVLVCHSKQSEFLISWFEGNEDLRFQLLLGEKSAPVEILNAAIQKAKGEYIAFLRAGDIWCPDKLREQVWHLNHYSLIGLVNSWIGTDNENDRGTGKTSKHQLCGWVESEMLERNQIDFSSVMVRRQCLNMVGLFDPSLKTAFDWDMWIRLSRCYQFMTIAESLVYHRQLPGKTEDDWLEREKDLQTAIEKAYQNASDKLVLKERSYAYASLSLAGQVMGNQTPDPIIAANYCRQALEHYPRIGFTRDFLQLSLAIVALDYIKSDRYLNLLSRLQTLRTSCKSFIGKFNMSINFFLNWLLQEGEIKNKHRKKVFKKDEG